MVSDIPYTDPDKPFYRDSYFIAALLMVICTGGSTWLWYATGSFYSSGSIMQPALFVMLFFVMVPKRLAWQAGRNKLETQALAAVWESLYLASLVYILGGPPYILGTGNFWLLLLMAGGLIGVVTALFPGFPRRNWSGLPDYRPPLWLAWGLPITGIVLGGIASLSGASDNRAVFIILFLQGLLVAGMKQKSVWFVISALLFIAATGVAISQMIS